MKNVVYALSGDPITYGHIDVIKRVLKTFDEIIIAVGNNPSKKYLFSLEERTQLITESLKGFNGIKVLSFNGLLSDFVYEQNVNTIIRGIRNNDDFNYELILHQINQTQNLGVETYFIPCSQDKTHISSSAVKAILLEQGFIHEYVPLNIKKALDAKLNNQNIIGVTGEIGVGKSSFCKKIIEGEIIKGNSAHHIDLDKIAHEILESRTEPIFVELRNTILAKFGRNVLNEEGFINRKFLGDIVFNDGNKLIQLNKLMLNPILSLLRKKLYGLKGLILIEGALLIEANLTFICNNEIVILNVDKETQYKRLKNRGLSDIQIQRRINSQFDYEHKKSKMLEIIENNKYGFIYNDTFSPI